MHVALSNLAYIIDSIPRKSVRAITRVRQVFRERNLQCGASGYSVQVIRDGVKRVHVGTYTRTKMYPSKTVTEQIETSRRTWHVPLFWFLALVPFRRKNFNQDQKSDFSGMGVVKNTSYHPDVFQQGLRFTATCYIDVVETVMKH